MTTVCIEIHTVLEPGNPGQRPKKLLVSIGMATSDGHRFYAVNSDTPLNLCIAQLRPDTWKALPLLEDPMQLDRHDPDVLPLGDIKAAFEAFIGQIDHPQFWSADGNADYRDLKDVLGHFSELLFPAGFPHWISSVREHRARVLDSIGHRDQESLHELQAIGQAELWPLEALQRSAFQNAHRLLKLLQATERLAQENKVDTTTREPAWLDWRHVWATGAAVCAAPRQDGVAVGRTVGEAA